MQQQLKLDGIPRPRTRLLPDSHFQEGDVIGIYVDTTEDHEVTFCHNGVEFQGLQVDGEFILYTEWMLDGERPNHQGFYQVLLQSGHQTATVMGFYQPEIDKFRASVDGDEVLLQRRKGRPWRGLSKPAPLGYEFYVEGCPTRMAPMARRTAPSRRVLLEE